MDTETGGENEVERPRDDEIQAFHNQIRAADAEKLEFVGDKVRWLPCFGCWFAFHLCLTG